MQAKAAIPYDPHSVIAVPPLAREGNGHLNVEANRRIVRHIGGGGIRHLLYGGNAFLYHSTLDEYQELLEWLDTLAGSFCCIPSLGPSFGRAMDQAKLLKQHRFACAMALPCNDPRDASGLDRGLRLISDAASMPLLLYCKSEGNFGPQSVAGLDVIGRLVADGMCIGIKYAVVRDDPAQDAYLEALLKRVDRGLVISGIGERPALTHLRAWGLPGFTTGSGCIAPALSQELLLKFQAGDFAAAEEIRQWFLPFEDLRNKWGPARVLHAAVQSAGIADTGPVPPFVSALSDRDEPRLAPTARDLLAKNRSFAKPVE